MHRNASPNLRRKQISNLLLPSQAPPATFGSKGIQAMKGDEEKSNYIKQISGLLGLY